MPHLLHCGLIASFLVLMTPTNKFSKIGRDWKRRVSDCGGFARLQRVDALLSWNENLVQAHITASARLATGLGLWVCSPPCPALGPRGPKSAACAWCCGRLLAWWRKCVGSHFLPKAGANIWPPIQVCLSPSLPHAQQGGIAEEDRLQVVSLCPV